MLLHCSIHFFILFWEKNTLHLCFPSKSFFLFLTLFMAKMRRRREKKKKNKNTRQWRFLDDLLPRQRSSYWSSQPSSPFHICLHSSLFFLSSSSLSLCTSSPSVSLSLSLLTLSITRFPSVALVPSCRLMPRGSHLVQVDTLLSGFFLSVRWDPHAKSAFIHKHVLFRIFKILTPGGDSVNTLKCNRIAWLYY